MILAVPEYTAAPTSPAQWDRYYNLNDDLLYIQTLPTAHGSYPTWVAIAQGAAVRDDMRHEITLTRSLYSAKDYQTFLDEVVAYIAEKWGDKFNDFMASEPAMMIAEYVAAAFDQMSWYLDREADDWYMELARVLSNVARLARYLGYKPASSVAASVDLLITLLNGPYAFDVPLKAGHRFEGPNGLIFELATDQTIPSGDTQKTIGVFQGQTYNEVFISDGSPNQEYNLSLVPDDEYLAQFKNQVVVNLDTWDEEDFLPYSAAESYEVLYLTSPPRLRFGNGVIGKVPASGAEVRAQYVATKGNNAALATSGTIKTSLTTVVVNFQQIPISVTNPNPATGGSPPATIDQIKTEAPRYFIAADRLVTQGDYNTLASQFSSVSGAVAKANALIIRGVSQDLELQSLMDALTADRVALDGYLDAIKTNQDDIKALTGDTATANTIRNQTAAVKTSNTGIRTETASIDTNVTTVKGNISDAVSGIELAQTRLDFLPFQELVGEGDGSTTIFAKTLAMRPIQAGSVTVLVASATPTKSATDGDCDTTPGRLISATIAFVTGDKGKMVRVGGEFRQITKYISATTIEYSGPRIYGTSLLVDVFPPAIIGYDDGAGNITGSGVTGTISYATGALSLTFTTAPEGIAGQYGVPIMSTYQYNGDAVKGVLDDAITDCTVADTNTDTFSTIGDTIDTHTTDSDGYADQIDTDADDIDTEADATKAIAVTAGTIPDQIQNDVDDLALYIDTMFSGDCKANVVRVSCLALDANGFYAAPSLALKGDLKTYLDARTIRTVQNSVVGGDFYLVKVKLLVQMQINSLFVFQTVQQAATIVLDALLKGRDYGAGLKRSDYYDVVKNTDGVTYCNVNISNTAYVSSLNTATPPAVDSNGNLFIDGAEVITKWEYVFEQIPSEE